MAASGRTPNFDLPYPVGSDSYAFLSDFQSLASTVDTKLGLMLPKAGGTLTGALIGTTLNLSSTLGVTGALTGTTATFSGTVSVGTPTTTTHATTKTYVDTALAAKLGLSGGTLTGGLSGTSLSLSTTLSVTGSITGSTAIFSGTITGATPTTSLASLNLPHGVAPTTPTNGDVWTTTAGIYTRINGATVGPLGTGGGGGTWGSITGTLSSQTDLNTALGLKSTVASPTFTGVVTTPGVKKAFATKTGAYTLTSADHVIVGTSGTWNATLPTAVGATGTEYVVKNSGAGIITVNTTSSQTIDAATTFTLDQYEAITVVSNGTNWVII